MSFIDNNYLITNQPGKEIYNSIHDLAIIDPHNHSDLKEIIENKNWNDLWEVQGKTDHYIWQLMRRMGVSEEKITGEASNKEKWMALAEIFPSLAGNPVFEWFHLDLKNIFGIEETISSKTAEKIWNISKEQLKEDRLKPQQLLEAMKVEVMCTTDDPVSDLKYHKLAKKKIPATKILPTWRPDKYSNIDKKDWKLSVTNIIDRYLDLDELSFDNFLKALRLSHDYFDEIGCVASDHDLPELFTEEIFKSLAKEIFEKAINNDEISQSEILKFKAFMLNYYADLNFKKNWIMQLHIGVVRNYRKSLVQNVGINSGGDIIGDNIDLTGGLKYFLNTFENLKIVAYVINQNWLPPLVTMARAFPNLNLGSAWWFNDSPYGMDYHLDYISSGDLLAKQTGMVTDSRKIMSYSSRTEMFRRTLANLLGEKVLKRQMPLDFALKIANELAYDRPLNLFFGNNS